MKASPLALGGRRVFERDGDVSRMMLVTTSGFLFLGFGPSHLNRIDPKIIFWAETRIFWALSNFPPESLVALVIVIPVRDTLRLISQ